MSLIPNKKSEYLSSIYIENCPKFGNILKTLEKEIAKKKLEPYKIEERFESLCLSIWPEALFPFRNIKNDSGYFDKSICLAVNDVVAHGNWKDVNSFNDGDLITIDCGFSIPVKLKTETRWLHFDSAFTTIFNKSEYKKSEEYRLLTANLNALKKISNSNIKNTYNISTIIEENAIENDVGIVVSLSGHGIGLALHEAPKIYNAKRKLSNINMFEGLVICIEPIYTLGNGFCKIYIDEDGWTIKTIEEIKTSHFESMYMYKDNKLIDLVGISNWSI